MSFRLFIYYCTLVGAWAAFLGWALARPVSMMSSNVVLQTLFYSLLLGLTVSFGLSLVDALWNCQAGSFVPIAVRVATALAVALLGGASCGGIGGFVYSGVLSLPYGNLLGSMVICLIWISLGLLIGLSVSIFDLFAGLARKEVRGSLKKLIKCVFGGTAGGMLGGIIASLLRFQVGPLLGDTHGDNLWSPTAYGFVTLGGLIGLLVGLSQVVLLEAWIKVEAGFRPGRDLILSRDRTMIGRAESSDIALFGDNGVDMQHATIVKESVGYFYEALPNTPGTYINEVPVTARMLLKTGDQIRLGKSLLRFNQRRK